MRLRTDDGGTGTALAVVVGVLLALFGVLAFLSTIGRWREDDLAGAALFVFWGTVVAWFAWKKLRAADHLRIDIAAGTLVHVVRGTPDVDARLEDVGELRIESHAGLHQLRAAGLGDRVLYAAARPRYAEWRRDLLARLIGESALRELLVTMSPAERGAFRAPPDAAYRARQLMPNAADLDRALAAFARDADATVRTNAQLLRNALSQSA